MMNTTRERKNMRDSSRWESEAEPITTHGQLGVASAYGTATRFPYSKNGSVWTAISPATAHTATRYRQG